MAPRIILLMPFLLGASACTDAVEATDESPVVDEASQSEPKRETEQEAPPELELQSPVGLD